MRCRVTGTFRSLLPSSKAVPAAGKRERVPTATVLPCSSDLKTELFEKASNVFVRELVTILGVNAFAWHEMKIKVRTLNSYILRLRALEVHLDPRFRGIPKHAMTEVSDIKVGSQFAIKTMQNV
jgi:hypothetical protein